MLSVREAFMRYGGNWQVGTDKCTGHTYDVVYDRVLTPYRERVGRLLELGICSGGSLLAFADLLPKFTVDGVDVSPVGRYAKEVSEHPRITTVINDFRKFEPVGLYDIIIDDASHDPRDQREAFSRLYSHLAPDGVYLIEDVVSGSTVAPPPGWSLARHELFRKSGLAQDCLLELRPAVEVGVKRRNAVVTLTIGDKFQRMAELTHPTIKRYADRIGADFVVIDERRWPEYHVDYEKFQFQDLLLKYDRLHFIDTDCIVRDDCPDLFQLVKPAEFGAFREGAFMPERMQALEHIAKLSGQQIQMNPDEWKGKYWNAGMMVVSALHRYIFTVLPPDPKVEGFGAQSWLNLLILNNKVKMKDLDYRFNRMTVMDAFTGEPRHASWIVHYAGCPLSEEPFLDTIREDLKVWASAAPEYRFKRNVCVQVGGGIGDVVDQEPVVRYVADVAYKDSNVFIVTNWPRLYEHLSDRVVLVLPGSPSPVSPMLTFDAFPAVEDPAARQLSHTMNHVTDYSSLSFLRRTLTADERQIQLVSSPQEIAELRKIYDKLEELVLVHAGAFWPSKTFPPEWWQAVVNGLVSVGLPVGLIGRQLSDEQGTVPIDAAGVAADFRNRTSLGEMVSLISRCRVVLSNDSAPVHIAGAFDCGIVLIPTCKHPGHVAPTRRRSQFWRQRWLYKKPMWERYDGRLTNYAGQSIDQVPGGDILEFLPEPSEVVEAVKGILDEV